MTNEKLKVAQEHINNYDMRIAQKEKGIETELHYIKEKLAQKDYEWLDNGARDLKRLTEEIMILKKEKQSMQELLDFLTREAE